MPICLEALEAKLINFNHNIIIYSNSKQGCNNNLIFR